MQRRRSLVALLGLYCLAESEHARRHGPSVCYGQRARGRLAFGRKLPHAGPNFRAYSRLGWLLGRTYVHDRVHAVVLAAYRILESRLPQRVFVYGETGWRTGGLFRPHRTHQNGLSVDFMVPVKNKSGAPLELPTGLRQRFGYGLSFDDRGRTSHGLKIDFEAVAEHLAALSTAARRERVRIRRVILAPALQKHLRKTKPWPKIRQLPFSRRPVWVRHDDHYHIDFGVPCRPISR